MRKIFISQALMAKSSPSGFNLEKYEALLGSFLNKDAVGKLSDKDKERMDAMTKKFIDNQKELLDLFAEIPTNAEILKRIEAHLREIPKMEHYFGSDPSFMNALFMLNDIKKLRDALGGYQTNHTLPLITPATVSLPDPTPAHPVVVAPIAPTVTPDPAPSVAPITPTATPDPAPSTPTPAKTPVVNIPKHTQPSFSSSPNSVTRKEWEQNLAAFFRKPENRLSSVDLQEIEKQLYAFLCGPSVSDQQKKVIARFMQERVKAKNDIFHGVRRCKTWIADYLIRKEKDTSPEKRGTIAITAEFETIKNNFQKFFAVPMVRDMILEQAREANIFHVSLPSKTTPASSTPKPTPTASVATPTATTPNVSAQPKLQQRPIWLPFVMTGLSENDTEATIKQACKPRLEFPLLIDGVVTKVAYKYASKLQDGRRILCQREHTPPGENPNVVFTLTGEARSLGNDGTKHVHTVSYGQLPGKISCEKGNEEQSVMAVVKMFSTCADTKALYDALHTKFPQEYPDETYDTLMHYAHERGNDPTTISVYELVRLFTSATQQNALDYMGQLCGETGDELEKTIVSTEQNTSPAPSPSVTTVTTPVQNNAPDPVQIRNEKIENAAQKYFATTLVGNNSTKAQKLREKIPALVDCIDIYGEAIVEGIAQDIFDRFHQDLFPVGGYDSNGMSWVYRDIAKQYFFFSHPETHADQTARGYSIANPIEDEPKQAEIANRMLGRYVYGIYTQGKSSGHEIFVTIEQYLNSLPPSQEKERMFALLRKSPTDGRNPAEIIAPNELSSKDLAELGGLMHASYATHGQLGPSWREDWEYTALEPSWLNEPLFAECQRSEEWKELYTDLLSELRDYHDPAVAPMIADLEYRGLQEPHSRWYANRHRWERIVSTATTQRFSDLMNEREAYRESQLSQLDEQEPTQTASIAAAKLTIQHTLSPEQQLLFDTFEPNLDRVIEDNFHERWEQQGVLPTEKVSAYDALVQDVVTKQRTDFCAQQGEVAAWNGDGANTILAAFRAQDRHYEAASYQPRMESWPTYMRNDPEMQAIKDTYERSSKVSGIRQRVKMKVNTIATKADWRRKRRDFKSREQTLIDTYHKSEAREAFDDQTVSGRDQTQDPFFAALGIHSVQVKTAASGSQEVAITTAQANQPGAVQTLSLQQNEYYQPHKMLAHIYNHPGFATPDNKRAAQRCYLKTYTNGILSQFGALDGEYQGEQVTISLDHTGKLGIQCGDQLWSEQALEHASLLERNQQLHRVYMIRKACFPHLAEKNNARNGVIEGNGSLLQTNRIQKMARQHPSISEHRQTVGQGNAAHEVVTYTIPDQESLNYLTLVVGGKTYAWSAGKRYLLKTVNTGQPPQPTMEVDTAYESLAVLLSTMPNQAKTLVSLWTNTLLEQYLLSHQQRDRQIIYQYAGSRYKASLANGRLTWELLATQPSAAYDHIAALGRGQQQVAGVTAFNDQLLVGDTRKEEKRSNGFFRKPSTSWSPQLSDVDITGEQRTGPWTAVAHPPFSHDIDALDTIVQALQTI